MHVAINGWFWGQPYTGSGRYVRHLVGGLRKVAPDLKLTLVLPPHVNPSTPPDGVDLVSSAGPKGKLGKVWFEQRTFPAQAAKLGADLAHVPYWGPPLTSPVPVVASVLDVIPLARPEYSSGLGARLYTSLVTTAARGAAQVLTLSEAAKADIVQHIGIPAARITPTHLAADDRFHPRFGAERDEDIRSKYQLPDQFVLYLGGFDRRKSVNTLLLAYTYVAQAEGDQVPLVLAGREPDTWGGARFPDLRAYVDELAIGHAVQWIGPVDDADLPALYRLADVFVYPSEYEGFGLPVLESMASGTPVVARDIPVMQEVSGDGAYLVDDARRMAGAIIALLLQKPLRDQMINQGLARATAFNWRKTAQQTYVVYQKALSELA